MRKSLWLLLFSVCVCLGQDGWERLDLPIPYDIDIAPSNSDYIYLTGGLGVFRSTDRGESYEDITPDTLDSIYLRGNLKLAVCYEDENIIYVFSCHKGLFRSFDAGETWEYRYEWDSDRSTHIEIERGNSNIVYFTEYLGMGGFENLFKTYDGGATVERIRFDCRDFCVSPSDPNIIYSYNGHFSISTDWGETWTHTGASSGGIMSSEILVDPYSPELIYFSTSAEVYSNDNGNTVYGFGSDKIYYDIGINFYNPVNTVVSYSPNSAEVRWQPETLLISSATRFTDLDTIVVNEAPTNFWMKNLEISSGSGSSLSPEIDYLFAVLEDSTGDDYLYRRDITEYGSARHYYQIERGWNLLSWCPRRDASDAREAVADLFSEAILPAYAWNAELGTYEAIDSFSPTQGFWLLSDSARVIEQDGLMTMDTVTVTLRRGWNLIGVQAVPLFADSLESLPVVVPPIYKWKDAEYQEARALVPEQGYWVLCSDSLSIGLR